MMQRTVIISWGNCSSSFTISLDAVILNELVGEVKREGEAYKGTKGDVVDGDNEDTDEEAIGGVN
jgi:hypothetical protein